MNNNTRQPAHIRKRSYLSQSQAALILLAPFLVIFIVFLVYPFFRGIWISLHDWNLLAVAFNPDAKEFVGTKNYLRVMWGGISHGHFGQARCCKRLG